MMKRLAASTLTLALSASMLPVAFADETTYVDVQAPSTHACEKTSGRSRARCITDAMKTWKQLDRDYNAEEKKVVAEWKAEHAHMGIGADYQKALRTFLSDLRRQRKEFQKQMLEFRKAFFDKQEAKREEGDGRKATEVKLEKSTLEAAKAICGPEDDDGAYRLCMRIQLRKKPVNVDLRSRTSTKLLKE